MASIYRQTSPNRRRQSNGLHISFFFPEAQYQISSTQTLFPIGMKLKFCNEKVLLFLKFREIEMLLLLLPGNDPFLKTPVVKAAVPHFFTPPITKSNSSILTTLLGNVWWPIKFLYIKSRLSYCLSWLVLIHKTFCCLSWYIDCWSGIEFGRKLFFDWRKIKTPIIINASLPRIE